MMAKLWYEDHPWYVRHVTVAERSEVQRLREDNAELVAALEFIIGEATNGPELTGVECAVVEIARRAIAKARGK